MNGWEGKGQLLIAEISSGFFVREKINDFLQGIRRQVIFSGKRFGTNKKILSSDDEKFKHIYDWNT